MAYSGFHVFGDSLVDAGNALKLAKWYGNLTFSDLPDGAPTPEKGYWQGRFSDGYTFADLVSNKLVGAVGKPVFPYGFEDPWLGVLVSPWASKPTGISLNWAYGGAQIRQGEEAVPDLDGQTDAFRKAVGGKADSGALYFITMGGNDVRMLAPHNAAPASQEDATAAIERAALELHQEIEQLIAIGVRDLVVTGIPNVGMIPRYDVDGDGVLNADEQARSDAATLYSQQLDAAIQVELQRLREASLTANIRYVSLTSATQQNLALLEALYGRPIDLTADGELMFFDKIHPNAQANALLAASILDSMNGTSSGNLLPLTAPDYSLSASIGVAGEVDKLVVTLAANTTYRFDMLGLSTLGGTGLVLADPTLRIVGPSGSLIGSNDDGAVGLDASFSFTTAAAGQYTIELRAVGALTGTYTLEADIVGGAANAGGNVYTVTSAGAVVLENADGIGRDIVKASVSYALAAGSHIEELRTTNDRGTGSINLTGNEYAQTIVGNSGANRIDGRGGVDELWGGSGKDSFIFTEAASSGVDRIRDFNVRDDTIWLENAVFTGLAAGSLPTGAFALATSGAQSDDRIIYDKASGALYFDPTGGDRADAVHFATLQANLSMTAADFYVI